MHAPLKGISTCIDKPAMPCLSSGTLITTQMEKEIKATKPDATSNQ